MSDPLLICTDLDRTLIPNGPQSESPLARKRFSRLSAHAGVTLVYISGRNEKLVRKAIRNFCLPQPDYVIGDVGSSMYRIDSDGRWCVQQSWEDIICNDWNGKTHDQLAVRLAGIKALRPQEPSKQNRHKLSYYVPMHVAGDDPLDQTIRQALDELGVRSNLIWSIDEPAAIGLLDILPVSASKLHALRYLMQQLGFTVDNTVFCGDSGNDMEILSSDIKAVLVANATPEVRAEALASAQANGWDERLYTAHGDFLGMNGNYSAGMLEGIVHFYPRTEAWMLLDETGARHEST